MCLLNRAILREIKFASRYIFHYLFLHLRRYHADCIMDMQTILNDIELDVQELKCLLRAVSNESDAALRMVARRNIRQMKARLDALLLQLDEVPAVAEPAKEIPSVVAEPAKEAPAAVVPEVPQASAPAASILAERIKPAIHLRQAISLNDSFRFTRELFGGDQSRMNEVVRRLGDASSLEEAMGLLASEVAVDEENEAVADFIELLKKYFN